MIRRCRPRTPAYLTALLCLPLIYGCNYSLSGGSFPDHVRTIAVIPFENETTRLELTQEVHDVMLRELPRALGVRFAGEDVADAAVQGIIIQYDVIAPNYRSSARGDRAEVLQRQVNLTVRVQIVDLVENVIIWEDAGLRVEGTYFEADETEDIGKTAAIELLIKRIVDGAQSNW